MNDVVAQAAKQEKVEQGKRILERIEKGFQQIHDLIGEGRGAGMMELCECHELQNKAMELHFATLGLHCRLTAIAKRNDCDVPDGGGPVVQGGPGR